MLAESSIINNNFKSKTTTTNTFHTIFGETLKDERIGTEHGVRITKTGSEKLNMELFSILVPFSGISIETVAAIFEIAMQYPDPAVFRNTCQAMASRNQ